MNNLFAELFTEKPAEIISNDYYFDSDRDGDRFDEADADLWLNKGRFDRSWDKDYLKNSMLYGLYGDVLNAVSKNPSPFLEIACGPGMGLTPVILSKYPQLPCLVSDACSLLIKSWRKYIDMKLQKHDISLASFSVMDIPLKSNSFDTVTSLIGISSTRAGESGKTQAIKEILRVLKPGGYFIGIENGYSNFNEIEKIFKLWGRPVWDGLREENGWPDRFSNGGFIVESCDKKIIRPLTKDDNDLGEQAFKHGIEINLEFTLIILRKP